MRIKKTTKRRVVRKKTVRISFLFDRALPLSLRWVGWAASAPQKEILAQSIPLQQQGHSSSVHVLRLREVPGEKPIPSFEQFAKEMGRACSSLTEETPHELRTEEEEAPSTFEELEETAPSIHAEVGKQLSENDANTQKWRMPHAPFFSMRLGWRSPYKRCHLHICRMLPSPLLRGVTAFVLFAFVSVLPLQMIQTASATANPNTFAQDHVAGWNNLLAGAQDLASADVSSANTHFGKASSTFVQAQAWLDGARSNIAIFLSILPKQRKTVEAADALTTAGKELSSAAKWITQGITQAQQTVDSRLGSRMRVLRINAAASLPHLKNASSALEQIDENALPYNAVPILRSLKNVLLPLSKSFSTLVDISESFDDLTGGSGSRRYLVLFQNNTELRATGGFIGSFAELVVHNGAISYQIPSGGSYEMQGALRTHLKAPGPMRLVNARWEFQDVNWFPDFPSTAKKALEFYEASGGPTLDGVIAVNAHLIPEILKVVGPISMPDYHLEVDAENFLYETQRQVEFLYDHEKNTPKQFLADLAPKLIEQLKRASFDESLRLFAILGTGLETKDVQLYLTDPAEEEHLKRTGWDGSLRKTEGDELAIVGTNIGGGKTDAVIDEDVSVKSNISEGGTIRHTVTITRTHTGVSGAPFTGMNNVAFMRLYVPHGSTLIGVDGGDPPLPSQFERTEDQLNEDRDLAFTIAAAEEDSISGALVWEENGFTVFGQWMQVRPGATSTLSFTYELSENLLAHPSGPWKKAQAVLGLSSPVAYTLYVQPQSGTWRRRTTVEVSAPQDRIAWSNLTETSGTVSQTIEGPRPAFVSFLLSP